MGRMVADHDGDVKRRFLPLGNPDVLAHVVGRDGIQAEPVRTMHLDAVYPHILLAEVVRVRRVPAHHVGLVDIETAVILVNTVQG